MDVATPWYKVIWLVVFVGECLGVVPAREVPRGPERMPEIVPEEANIALATAAGHVTVTVIAVDGEVREVEIPPRPFPACEDAPCPACTDGSTVVPDLPRVHEILVEFKARPDLARVDEITIAAHEDVLYQDIVHLMDVSRATLEVAADATPCQVLAARSGAGLFPNVVLAVKE